MSKRVRKPLFRGKDERNGEWVHGFLSKTATGSRGMQLSIVTGTERGCMMPIFVKPGTIGEYAEILKAYEDDVLFGQDTDEFLNVSAEWFGLVAFNEKKGRLMVVDDLGEWYEVDDFDFVQILGNVIDSPGLLMHFANSTLVGLGLEIEEE